MATGRQGDFSQVLSVSELAIKERGSE